MDNMPALVDCKKLHAQKKTAVSTQQYWPCGLAMWTWCRENPEANFNTKDRQTFFVVYDLDLLTSK